MIEPSPKPLACTYLRLKNILGGAPIAHLGQRRTPDRKVVGSILMDQQEAYNSVIFTAMKYPLFI